MLNDSNIDYDKIAKLCYDFYEKNLLIKSKPAKNEWTNLASILMHSTKTNEYKILSIATGSKCLAEKQLPLDGTLVYDSHAEVLARRCFIRFIYNEMNQILQNENYISEIIELGDKKFLLKSNIEFILFTSHTPCGDASIIPKPFKRGLEKNEDEHKSSKKVKIDLLTDDIYRTGAKCVPNSEIQDPKEKGVLYHITGVVRTKPGRGDPTISMSCSDKIAKWLILGIQGSLMSILLDKPIYLNAIVIGKCPYNFDCIKRALIDRSQKINGLTSNYKLTVPIIGQSNLIFKDSKLAKNPDSKDNNEDEPDLKACPNAVCWTYKMQAKPLFILVKGYLQGTAKNSNKKLTTIPPICKYFNFDNFTKIYEKLNQEELSKEKKYYEIKQLASEYKKNECEFFEIYKDWLRTDPIKYYNFSLK